jgi:hypothetical protein
LYAFGASSGSIVKKTGISFTNNRNAPGDITGTSTPFGFHFAGVALDGATDAGSGGTIPSSTYTTKTGTSGNPSVNTISGSLSNNSSNALPPHLGLKYLIKT